MDRIPLTIRLLETDHDWIKNRAEKNKRSINKEIEHIIENIRNSTEVKE
jgi:Tat protein secretion system quality control protein TatD with DNase activity